jgi:hypothetical protein
MIVLQVAPVDPFQALRNPRDATFEVPFQVTAFIPKLGEMLTDPEREIEAAINGDLTVCHGKIHHAINT